MATVAVYTIGGEKLTVRNTTKKAALKFLAKNGLEKQHIFRVEVTA